MREKLRVSVVHSNVLTLLLLKGKKKVARLICGDRGRKAAVLLCVSAAGDPVIPLLCVSQEKEWTTNYRRMLQRVVHLIRKKMGEL
jgi:hypothetical protein